jgi:hypothetical protein
MNESFRKEPTLLFHELLWDLTYLDLMYLRDALIVASTDELLAMVREEMQGRDMREGQFTPPPAA